LLFYFWKVSKKIKSILLVDDDSDDQLLFQEALEEVDGLVRCITATNGSNALEILTASSIFPDLIIMDVNMPIMNGMECLKAIKSSEEFRAINVIMYSTSCSRDCQKECFDNGASAYLEKPSDFNLLRSRIKAILITDFTAVQQTPVIV